MEQLERLKAYGQSEVEAILLDHQITNRIEALGRAEIQKIAEVLAKGKTGGYKGDALYNRRRTARNAAQRSGDERIVSKRKNNLLNKTTANDGGFSIPETFGRNTVIYDKTKGNTTKRIRRYINSVTFKWYAFQR